MKVLLAADHAGFELKEKIKKFLLEQGFQVEDKGAFKFDPDDDYPDFVTPVAKEVALRQAQGDHDAKGIVIGGSGQGEAICANRFPGIRAAVFYGGPQEIIKLSREHNNANVLSLGARFLKKEEAFEAVKMWLETPFSKDGRHMRRLEKIEEFNRNQPIHSYSIGSLKDFDGWNLKKKNIHSIEERPFFHEREIWFCYIGINVGFEQDGKGGDYLRPIVVIRKFNNQIFWGIPLTKKEKTTQYYFTFSLSEKGKNTAILSQIRLIDARRLSYRIGGISKQDFQLLKNKLKALLP